MCVCTWPLALRDSVDEADHAGAAEELGDEDGGMALGFRGVDAQQGGAEDAGIAAAFPQDSATIATHGKFGRDLGYVGMY